MSGTSLQRGFTIVETLIVLAVMSALFLAAMTLVNGKQNQVEFTQAINDIEGNIQQTINDVSNGYFNNISNFSCNGTTGSLTITSGSSIQGQNTGCVFLGKAIEFGVTGTDPQNYVTFPIAGLQSATDLSTAAPTAVAPGVTHNTGLTNSGVISSLHNGLTAVSMKYNNGGSWQPIGAVAFISGLGSYSGGKLLSGTQSVSLVPIAGSDPAGTLKTSPQKIVDYIDTNMASSPINPSQGVEICFASGGTNQSGLITIGGGDARTLSVTLQIESGKVC